LSFDEDRLLRKLALHDRRIDKEVRQRVKRSEDFEVMEEVFDRSTMLLLYRLIVNWDLNTIEGCVSAGKEARVYYARGKSGTKYAVKIYLTATAEFRKGMLKYIEGDFRFRRIRRDTRHLIYTWAKKEFKNLKTFYEAGVRVPRPYRVLGNILVMEFVGYDGVPAPLIREVGVEPNTPEQAFNTILSYIRLGYQRAQLVHGDLSEYNVMNYDGELIIIDVSQAVPVTHHLAMELLYRDVRNICRWFERVYGLEADVERIVQEIVGGSA